MRVINMLMTHSSKYPGMYLDSELYFEAMVRQLAEDESREDAVMPARNVCVFEELESLTMD